MVLVNYNYGSVRFGKQVSIVVGYRVVMIMYTNVFDTYSLLKNFKKIITICEKRTYISILLMKIWKFKQFFYYTF